MNHLKETSDLIYSQGALPKKYKLILAMAFDVAYGADKGIRALARAAMELGATREETAQALHGVFSLAGVAALYTGCAGLKGLVGYTGICFRSQTPRHSGRHRDTG